MNKYSILDNETFTFCLKLKTTNAFWYRCLIQCAKQNPSIVKECLQSACKHIGYVELNSENVNPFQICKAVNSGALTTDSFDGMVGTGLIETYRRSLIQKFKDDRAKKS